MGVDLSHSASIELTYMYATAINLWCVRTSGHDRCDGITPIAYLSDLHNHRAAPRVMYSDKPRTICLFSENIGGAADELL